MMCHRTTQQPRFERSCFRGLETVSEKRANDDLDPNASVTVNRMPERSKLANVGKFPVSRLS
jgi:hypothetical protein